MKQSIGWCCLVICVLACGCQTTTSSKKTNATSDPDGGRRVELLFDQPSRPYTIVGRIDASSEMERAGLPISEKLRRKASLLGADAVIVQGNPGDVLGTGPDRSASGIAIRYNAAPPAQ